MSESTSFQDIPVALIDPNPFQPRTHFDEGALRELGESIRRHGVQQRVKVRPVGSGKKLRYQLVYGERRLRASKLVGLATIPAVVEQMDDEAMELVALTENVQREDLTPIEEAVSYRKLLERACDGDLFALSQKVGKSADTIRDRIDLLELPEEVQGWVDKGPLTLECAKVLCALDTPAVQITYAKLAMSRNLTAPKLKAAAQRELSKSGKGVKRNKRDMRVGRKVTDKSVTSAMMACWNALDKFEGYDQLTDEQIESLSNQSDLLRKSLDDLRKRLRR